jgi:hypothetical protein
MAGVGKVRLQYEAAPAQSRRLVTEIFDLKPACR